MGSRGARERSSSLSSSLSASASAALSSGASATFVQASARSAANGDSYGARVGYDGSTALLGSATDYSETLTFTIAVN